MVFKDQEGKEQEVFLMDDGTMDTVIKVNSKEYRYDCEFASRFRRKDGSMTQKGLIKLAEDALENDWE